MLALTREPSLSSGLSHLGRLGSFRSTLGVNGYASISLLNIHSQSLNLYVVLIIDWRVWFIFGFAYISVTFPRPYSLDTKDMPTNDFIRSLKSQHNLAPFHASLKDLAQGLPLPNPFNDPEDVKRWLTGYLFEPFYALLRDKLQEEYDKAEAGGMRKPRGPVFAAVHLRIISCELMGQRKYSREIATKDTSGWDLTDHFAHFLYATVHENTVKPSGIFYHCKDTKLVVRQWAVWQALVYYRTLQTESKRKRILRSEKQQRASASASASAQQ